MDPYNLSREMNLTEEQKRTLDLGEVVHLTIDGRDCVLLPEAVYERIKEEDDDQMDYGPMTPEEMNLLADEAAEIIAQQETTDHFDET